MALQIRADEWFNQRVYYGFYGVHSEWTPEHEQGRRKKKKTGTYAFAFLSFHFLQFLKVITLKDTSNISPS